MGSAKELLVLLLVESFGFCDGEGGAAWETFRILLGANQKSDCTVYGNDRKTGLVV